MRREAEKHGYVERKAIRERVITQRNIDGRVRVRPKLRGAGEREMCWYGATRDNCSDAYRKATGGAPGGYKDLEIRSPG